MKTLTYEEVSKVLSYNPETGEFLRLAKRGKGKLTKGCLDVSNGYLLIGVCGVQPYAHRLAWLLTHKSWPTQTIDHINRNKTDNRLHNLRDVSYSDNNANIGDRSHNTSGLQGVSWHAKARKWMAQIRRSGRYYYLGLFESIEDAKDLRDLVADEFAAGGFVPLQGLK